MDTETQNRAAEIAAINDEHRRNMTGCIVTKGVAELTPLVNDIFTRVRDFKNFTEDNDPYGEHDFGSFEILGIKIFWKIDYYDENLERWCDPLSPDCHRKLTIMRAEEY
jgi:hypothetical protein